MMTANEMKKYEVTETELETVAGGAYSLETIVNAFSNAFDTVTDTIGNAVEYVADTLVDTAITMGKIAVYGASQN